MVWWYCQYCGAVSQFPVACWDCQSQHMPWMVQKYGECHDCRSSMLFHIMTLMEHVDGHDAVPHGLVLDSSDSSGVGGSESSDDENAVNVVADPDGIAVQYIEVDIGADEAAGVAADLGGGEVADLGEGEVAEAIGVQHVEEEMNIEYEELDLPSDNDSIWSADTEPYWEEW